jgi:PLP dependent protein
MSKFFATCSGKYVYHPFMIDHIKILSMSEITSNYQHVSSTIPDGIRLIAVSKTKSPEQIMELYNSGQREFGESKIQELLPKVEKLPRDIVWHMIGHLQTNKVKYIAPFVSLIHSVDSFKLLQAINNEAVKNNRVIDCLLQMHIAEEETKYGLSMEEVVEILASAGFSEMKNIRITGLMCMATFTEDREQIRREFRTLKNYFRKIQEQFFSQTPDFTECSMGMSDDYDIAIEEGSTMLRIGSRLFGHRDYN